MHSLLLSRRAAEHLALDRDSICALVARCYAWFGHHGFDPPQLYVPPAWAMGAVTRGDMDALPFRYYETLTGVYDSAESRFRRLPVVGFEADNRARYVALKLANLANRLVARRVRPLRLAIHPGDFGLLLSGALDSMLPDAAPGILYADLDRAAHAPASALVTEERTTGCQL